ncbi:hypothetical protein VTJ04DRAFT_4666 [Mycothermus thermophilus]|uniref:uncharacterized protein n=1 Tax=Humicola insolens TaxID=85995 RepID=UPI003744014E
MTTLTANKSQGRMGMAYRYRSLGQHRRTTECTARPWNKGEEPQIPSTVYTVDFCQQWQSLATKVWEERRGEERGVAAG